VLDRLTLSVHSTTFSPNILVLLPCLFFIVLVTGILCYKAHQLTVVVPKVVDEQELEMEIERRGDVLKKKAISALQEKERKFQEQVARDEEDRKQRKAQKKAQLKFEAQLMAQRRQQQLAMAHEVLSRQNSTAISMLNLSGRTTPVEDRSDASSYRDVATDYGSNPPTRPPPARRAPTDGSACSRRSTTPKRAPRTRTTPKRRADTTVTAN
jgi:hypothetical protein